MKAILFSFLFFILLPASVYSQQTSNNARMPLAVRRVKITDLQKMITNSSYPMIINFWATYCIPCLQEIPYFEEEVARHASDSLQLILVSLDMKEAYPDSINGTVTKRKITAPVIWLDETNADYFCPKVDSSWSGGIPASLFINKKTGQHTFFEEQLSKERLVKEIEVLLKK